MADHLTHHPPYARWAHILLRLFVGAVMVEHGVQKLFGMLGGFMASGHAVSTGSLLWYSGVIETVLGTLVFIGLFTRIASFILSGELATAYFLKHISQSFWPILNKGELAAVLCFVFLYFTATGAGAFSLDYIRLRRKPQPVMP